MATTALFPENRTQSGCSRLNALVELNIGWLDQALAVVNSVSEQVYAEVPVDLAPHRAGGHLRHVLEFYECFLDGIAGGRVDYDGRRRDLAVERSRAAAAERIESLIERLRACVPDADGPLLVRAEDADALELDNPFLESSMARELLTLSSHTIHHFALIAMTLRAHGVAVDARFGIAPSTLRHQEKLRNAEAA